MGHIRYTQDNFRSWKLFTQITADGLAKVDYFGVDAFLGNHVKPSAQSILSTSVRLFFVEMLDNTP